MGTRYVLYRVGKIIPKNIGKDVLLYKYLNWNIALLVKDISKPSLILLWNKGSYR